MKIHAEALERAKKIKLIIFDVDGVLTDGGIYLSGDGELFKAFHCRDGFGVALANAAGIKTAIITGRKSECTSRRAAELKIPIVMQGQMNKRNAYKELKEMTGFNDEEIAYVADDVIDLPVFVQVGFRAAVGDASEDVKERAHYVANCFGGKGAVREIIEFILKSKNLWKEIIERYTTADIEDKHLTSLNQ